MAERLAQAPPNRTEITLYGATTATYEAVTGVPGSYARCCAGIEALVKRHIPLGLKTTITRQNVDELEAMRQMAHNWGVQFSGGWLLSRRPDGEPSEVDNCRLSASDCVALEATDRASAHEWTEAALRESSAGNDNNFYCQAGKAAFVINPEGEMNVCLDLPSPRARPLEIGFPAAWEQVQRFVDSAPPLASTCLACDARVYCGRCPAWSSLENNTLTEPVRYLCEIARRERSAMPNLHKIPITIADILIEVTSPLSAAELGIEQRLSPFFGASDNPIARVSLHLEESNGAPSPCGELIYDPGFIWRMYRAGEVFYAAISYQDECGATNPRSLLRQRRVG